MLYIISPELIYLITGSLYLLVTYFPFLTSSWFHLYEKSIIGKSIDTDQYSGFPNGSFGKESACNAGDLCSIPWSGRFPGKEIAKEQPTPVFLPEEFHGQRSLVGYSPWGHKESDRTE